MESTIIGQGISGQEIHHRLLGRVAMKVLNKKFRDRDVSILTKIRIIRKQFFLECYIRQKVKSEKAASEKLKLLNLRLWRRLLGIPWISKKINKQIQRQPKVFIQGTKIRLK